MENPKLPNDIIMRIIKEADGGMITHKIKFNESLNILSMAGDWANKYIEELEAESPDHFDSGEEVLIMDAPYVICPIEGFEGYRMEQRDPDLPPKREGSGHWWSYDFNVWNRKFWELLQCQQVRKQKNDYDYSSTAHPTHY